MNNFGYCISMDWYRADSNGFWAQCPLTGRVVQGEGNRGLRYKVQVSQKQGCLFCPGQEESQLPEVTRLQGGSFADFLDIQSLGHEWSVRVFPNLFKGGGIGSKDLVQDWKAKYRSEEGQQYIDQLLERLKEKGLPVGEDYLFDLSHMVIVGTPEHKSDLNQEEAGLEFLAAVHARNLAYQDEKVVFGCIYKNQGKAAGATQEHEHVQLRCYTELPPRLSFQVSSLIKNPGLMEQVTDFARIKDWVISDKDNQVSFVVPWEEEPAVWLVYKGLEASLEELGEVGLLRLSGGLQTIIAGLKKLGYSDYNYAWFDSSRLGVKMPIHAKIVTRKKVRGGSDIFLGPEKHYVRPESLAEVLRNA